MKEKGFRSAIALATLGYYSDAPDSQHYPFPFGFFYPDRGNFLGLVTDVGSRSAMLRLARAFKAASDFPLEHVATFRAIPGVDWSDHRSFWDAGYPALMATDTAPFRYPHYHLPEDRPDKLTYPEFARATEGLFHACARFAEDT